MLIRLFHAARALMALLAAAAAFATPAHAGMGLATLSGAADDGPVTVFYPTTAADSPTTRGPFTLALAVDAPPAPGNGRLVVVSHGSGGTPWVHADLARAMVDAGFVVAVPRHRGDNALDPGRPGPDSWALRPGEVSRAIDAVGRDPRFAPRLGLDRVGVYGMSAGGHTALVMAGGRWSRAGFKRHCEQHLNDDFSACVGLATQLRGNVFDGVKRGLARAVIAVWFDDDTVRAHRDDRVAAVVAAVPFAADFDFASLTAPPVPLALVTSGRDAWLRPAFHSGRVLAACTTCEHLVDLPAAGHGVWLSPSPPGLTGLAAELLDEPHGATRDALPEADRAIAAFFVRHLLRDAQPDGVAGGRQPARSARAASSAK